MTARDLQDALVADLRALFSDRRYKTPNGDKAVPTVVEQALPKRQSDADDDPFPYIIVRLDSGGIDTQTDPHKVSIIILVGVFDDDPQNQGHKDVLEILEAVQNHYEEAPLLAGKYRMDDPFGWALQDEESYPYYFGAANLTWAAPAARRNGSEFT